MLLEELNAVFAPDGPLAQGQDGYRSRPAQLELARAIDQAIQDRSVLVAEAGTGTGKTWAYLVPALLSGVKVLVSTGTRTLQDQLYRRDLPRLRKSLALPVVTALLKGRGNYVCHYHLGRLEQDDRGLKSRQEITQLREIRVFTDRSKTGDKAELSTVPENAPIWSRVVSTRENCLGQDCPNVRDCFVLKARREAQDADLVVVNHALFMADLALREEGITDLLPQADLIVFDEAHQLPDVATRFLGSSVSSTQLLDLCRTSEAAGLAYAREAVSWTTLSQALETASRDLRLASQAVDRLPGGRVTFDAIPNPEEFDQKLELVLVALDELITRLQVVAEKHPDLQAACNTALEVRARLFRWSQPDRNGHDALAQEEGDDTPLVRWVESNAYQMRLHSAPLSVAKLFSRYRRADQAWVFTSATLSVNGDFSYFQRQLGLHSAVTAQWESPFDYATQGLLYVPDTLPPPQSSQFNKAFIDTLMPLIKLAPGGVLVLCTTLRAVDLFADMLAQRFEALGLKRTLLRQGAESRQLLLDRFRALDDAVLVGSASFWEGIDVPGDALTVVAIDRLPFAPPDDPVLEARLNDCRRRGGNPFMEFQIPEAAVALKQGAGRLIRTETDWGVLLVGDVRLVEKPYGRVLWRGLPPFARTRHAAQVMSFLQARKSAAPEVSEE